MFHLYLAVYGHLRASKVYIGQIEIVRFRAIALKNAGTLTFKFKNTSGTELILVIEPWAVEFRLPMDSSCEVVSVGGVAPSDMELEILDDRVVFFVNTSGAIYEYWQDGKLAG